VSGKPLSWETYEATDKRHPIFHTLPGARGTAFFGWQVWIDVIGVCVLFTGREQGQESVVGLFLFPLVSSGLICSYTLWRCIAFDFGFLDESIAPRS